MALLTLAMLPTLPVSVPAETVEDAPTNCCTEIYWVGWELGRLRSIASYPTPTYRQDASLHMQRLSNHLETANGTCCGFCEAWAEWPAIQEGIRTTADDLLGSSQSDGVETRRAFHEWTEARPARLLEGLNRCALEEGSPCKWLGLVDCARAYFQLGVQLGHAVHTLSAASDGVETGLVLTRNARQDGLESLESAGALIAALRADDRAPGSTEPRMRCDYLWETETGAERLLSAALQEPQLHTDAQLAAKAAEAHRIILGLLLDGRPDLGIAPCPIGAAHDHAECEFAEEHGHQAPEGQER
jgi:hypothetical protein